MKVMKKLKLKVNMQSAFKRGRKAAKQNYKMMTWRTTWKVKCPMIN